MRCAKVSLTVHSVTNIWRCWTYAAEITIYNRKHDYLYHIRGCNVHLHVQSCSERRCWLLSQQTIALLHFTLCLTHHTHVPLDSCRYLTFRAAHHSTSYTFANMWQIWTRSLTDAWRWHPECTTRLRTLSTYLSHIWTRSALDSRRLCKACGTVFCSPWVIPFIVAVRKWSQS